MEHLISLSSIFVTELFHTGHWTWTHVLLEENLLFSAEATLQRIVRNPTVQDAFVYDAAGMVVRSTLDTARTQSYRSGILSLSAIARKTVKNIDPRDDLDFIRMRTGSIEMIISPDCVATLVVIQSVQPYEPPTRLPKENIAKK